MEPIPVPRDFPMPMPISGIELELVMVLVFLAHILFVNFMVGGSLLAVFYEWLGLRDGEYDVVAREISATVTVNKSLAVVLGVAPLLAISVMYPLYWYTTNALTGIAWMSVVPLVAMAFLITYAHKYSWDALADHKHLHIAIGAVGALLFLAVPFVFLTNINLMLFPERWPDVHGFLSALLLPNVIPRYLHFLVASLAVSGLFFAGYVGRAAYALPEGLQRLDRPALRRQFAALAFGATAVQLLAGPLLLATLPARGLSWGLVINIGIGLLLALGALHLLWQEMRSTAPGLGPRYWMVVALLTGTVLFMGYGRHLYREHSVDPHRALVADKTENYQLAVTGARMREATGQQRIGPQEAAASPGERSFKSVCMACHDVREKRVGPPLVEIAPAYADDVDGMIAWIKKPGRKRTDYPEMPPITMSEDQYRAVAEYVLQVGLGGGTAAGAAAAGEPGGADDDSAAPDDDSAQP